MAFAPAIPAAAAAASAAGGAAATGAAVAGTAAAATATTAAAASTSWLSSLLVGTAANVAAGTGATAGLIGAGGSLTLGGVLSGALTVGGLVTSLMGARSEAAAYKADAKTAEFQARQERLAGKVEGNRIREEALRTLSAQRARWGAAGIDLSSATAQAAQSEAASDADLQLGLSRADAQTRTMARRMSARRARSQASAAYQTGGVAAATGLLDFASAAVNRGM